MWTQLAHTFSEHHPEFSTGTGVTIKCCQTLREWFTQHSFILACIQKQYAVVVTTQVTFFLNQNLKKDYSNFCKLSCEENILVYSLHKTCSDWKDIDHVSPNQGERLHVRFYHIKSTSYYINTGHVLNHWLKWKESQRYGSVHKRNAFAFIITNVITLQHNYPLF